MSLGLVFWILMLLWLLWIVFGVWWLWPPTTNPYWPHALFQWVLFLLLGWHAFGPPIRG